MHSVNSVDDPVAEFNQIAKICYILHGDVYASILIVTKHGKSNPKL